jgi:hypothetical protein
MAAMRNAALHKSPESLRFVTGRTNGGWAMGFKTELFSRPRPDAQAHYRAALALLHAMCKADRSDPGVRPADFPRLARQLAVR